MELGTGSEANIILKGQKCRTICIFIAQATCCNLCIVLSVIYGRAIIAPLYQPSTLHIADAIAEIMNEFMTWLFVEQPLLIRSLNKVCGKNTFDILFLGKMAVEKKMGLSTPQENSCIWPLKRKMYSQSRRRRYIPTSRRKKPIPTSRKKGYLFNN